MSLSYQSLLAYIDGLYADGQMTEQDYNQVILYILANGNLENSPRDLIQVRRGNEENLPNLAQGELGFTLDTHKIVVGGLNGNVEFTKPTEFELLGESVAKYGAVGDGIADDTNAIIEAFNVIKENGGVLLFEPNKTYLVDGTVINHDGVKNVKIKGFNTTIKQKPTTTEYSTIYFHNNFTIEGVTLEGYVESGTGYATVTPQWSFGFRSHPEFDGLATFINCNVKNYPFDGYYHSGKGRMKLIDCGGHDCYRNVLAVVSGSVEIDGGVKWGDNVRNNILGSVACIDIEPNTDQTVDDVVIKNIKTSNLVEILSGAGGSRIKNVLLENCTFTDETPNVLNGLKMLRADLVTIKNLKFEGNSKIIRGNITPTGQSLGRIDYDGLPQSSNKVNVDYNSLVGWSSSSNGGTVTIDNEIGMFKGIRIETVSSSGYRNLSTTVPVEENEVYTFGCLMNTKAIAGAGFGFNIFIDGVRHTIQTRTIDGVQYISGSVKIPEGVSEVLIKMGSEGSNPIDITFANVFCAKGLFSFDKVR